MTVLNSYPAYKPSGAEWLGDVPANWEVSTLRRRLRTYGGIKIGPFGSQLKLEQMSPSGYKVYGQANVIARDFARGTKFVDQEKFNELSACVVLPGDLLVTMMGTSGRCAYVPDDAVMGIMDSHLLRLRTNGSLNIKFASLIIDESSYVKDQIETAGKGSIMHGLNSSIVKDLVLALPPLSEQTAIVRFLDHADRRIRLYIRSKQKLIALLEEQKQAIIHQAVTGQVDVRTGQPYTAYKPSGVEWLGDVPTHWETPRIKQCARTISKGTTPSTEGRETSEYGQVRFLKAENITSGEISDKPLLYIDEDTNNLLRRSQLQEGDVLFVIAGATLGKTALVREELLPANTNQAVAFIRPHKRLDSIYLAYWLQSPRVKELTWLNAVQSAQPNLSMTNLGNFFIPFSPFPEQAVIVSYLDRATAAVDIVIRHTRYQIDHLSEYRTRLIADVVTGKFDVREAAAALPEVDPLAAEDDLNDTFDTEVEADLDELVTILEEAEA